MPPRWASPAVNQVGYIRCDILGICLCCESRVDVIDHLDVLLIGVVDVLGRLGQVFVKYTAYVSHVCANPASGDKVPHRRLCRFGPLDV